jgi:hypothetical protein
MNINPYSPTALRQLPCGDSNAPNVMRLSFRLAPDASSRVHQSCGPIRYESGLLNMAVDFAMMTAWIENERDGTNHLPVVGAK